MFARKPSSILAIALCMAPNTGAASGGPAADDKKHDTDVKTEAAPEKQLANIIRGRMPVAVVALVRFGDNKNAATKDLAKMFGTTVGKIDDIKKNRNFGYVKADFKPTQEQKDEGIAWLQRHPDFDKGTVDKLINEAEAVEVATAEEAAAFATARTEARGHNSNVTTKTGETADGGGGNRVKSGKAPKAPKAEVQAAGSQASAEELLA